MRTGWRGQTRMEQWDRDIEIGANELAGGCRITWHTMDRKKNLLWGNWQIASKTGLSVVSVK